MTTASSSEAQHALDACAALITRLHKMCCEPDRSPTMIGIQSTLTEIEADLASAETSSLARNIERLEDVGATIGRLQIGCCAPARMPLYGEALAQLNTIQLAVSEELRARGDTAR